MHEYGHTVQESIIGTPLYTVGIAVPSVIGYAINSTDADYFSRPWERTADYFGGVDRGGYTEGSLETSLDYFQALIDIKNGYRKWSPDLIDQFKNNSRGVSK